MSNDYTDVLVVLDHNGQVRLILSNRQDVRVIVDTDGADPDRFLEIRYAEMSPSLVENVFVTAEEEE